MRRNKLFIILFLAGVSMGIIFGFRQVKASIPDDDSGSGGEPQASVTYDETWRAVQALTSSQSGYQYFYPYSDSVPYPLPLEPATNKRETDVSGQMEKTSSGWMVKISPKMVVTKWKVHGHIHFD